MEKAINLVTVKAKSFVIITERLIGRVSLYGACKKLKYVKILLL